jgi:hypothetical protein
LEPDDVNGDGRPDLEVAIVIEVGSIDGAFTARENICHNGRSKCSVAVIQRGSEMVRRNAETDSHRTTDGYAQAEVNPFSSAISGEAVVEKEELSVWKRLQESVPETRANADDLKES